MLKKKKVFVDFVNLLTAFFLKDALQTRIVSMEYICTLKLTNIYRRQKNMKVKQKSNPKKQESTFLTVWMTWHR